MLILTKNFCSIIISLVIKHIIIISNIIKINFVNNDIVIGLKSLLLFHNFCVESFLRLRK